MTAEQANIECIMFADDLSGACDTGVQFARRGMSCRVQVRVSERRTTAMTEVLAFNTNSRNDTAVQCQRKIEEVARHFSHLKADIIFKKVDSTLRGQVGEEIATALRAFKCEAATEMCLMGKAHGMVTAPVNKEAVTMSGIPFSGHTEYIAGLCGAPDSRMMLSNAMLNVIHVTTHVSLRNAIEAPTARILRTIKVGNEAMKLLGWEHPRIAMCGINPHAGEHGLFGIEDAERIIPAIEAARATGVLVDGPHAPDTVFMRAIRGEYDMVVALYHDQGHIAMKLIDFEHTVNVTLGIPIIRTSVDDGTAIDIAGKNKASPQNMIAALRMGVALASRKIAGSQTELEQKD